MITALRFWVGMGAFATVWTALAIRSGVFLSSPRSIELDRDTPSTKKLWAAFWAFVFLCLITIFFIFPTLRGFVSQVPKDFEKSLKDYEKISNKEPTYPLGSLEVVAYPRNKGWSMEVRVYKGCRVLVGSKNGMRVKVTTLNSGKSMFLDVPGEPQVYEDAKRGRLLIYPPKENRDRYIWPGSFGEYSSEDISFQFQSLSNKDEDVACFIKAGF